MDADDHTETDKREREREREKVLSATSRVCLCVSQETLVPFNRWVSEGQNEKSA